jgi:arylsulfatase A-like enzyme
MEAESTSSQNPEGLYWPRMSLLRSEGAEHTLAVMCRTKDFKYVRRLYESDELYDLHADPQELHNLIGDPAQAETLAALKERLLMFSQETCDVVPHTIDRRA